MEKIKFFERKDENIIGQDFQGWYIYKMSLREILMELGAELVTAGNKSYLALENTNPILDAFPRTYEDDGMAYPINERAIVEVNDEIYVTKLGDRAFNLFVDCVNPKMIKKLKKEYEKMSKLIEGKKC